MSGVGPASPGIIRTPGLIFPFLCKGLTACCILDVQAAHGPRHVRHKVNEEPVMNPVAACPSRLDLERLMQGQMPYTHVEQLAEHLEGCDACVKIVQALQVEDTLAELIRNQAKAQGKPPDAALKNLMERLRGLRTAKGGAN